MQLITEAHERLLGQPLVSAISDLDALGAWLFEEAPYCLLAHSADADPRFIYANEAALRCFEFTWDEFIGMPSRLSAEAPHRGERDGLLQAVAERGYARGYRGLRIAKSGRRFWIEDVTMWNLMDAQGRYLGQAATYARTTPVAP